MAYELDYLGPEGKQGDSLPPHPAVVTSDDPKQPEPRCTVKRMGIVSFILAILLVTSLITIPLVFIKHFEDKSKLETSALFEAVKAINKWDIYTQQIIAETGGQTYTVNVIKNGTNKGSMKGPAIHVRNGDLISINVTNGIADSKLSVHWHGLIMKNNQAFDGAVGLTQCPIAYGKSYVYKWQVMEQPGTYWYHTHGNEVDPSGQDFIRGPFIVHEHDAPSIPDGNYDYQFGNGQEKETILFYVDIYPNFIGFDYAKLLGGGGSLSWSDESIEGDRISSGLLKWAGGTLNGEDQPVIQVDNGLHTFRIINGGSQTPFLFSIDKYKLTVVASDGYPVEPYETDVVQIGIAERYDVKVNFNITTDTQNVWIRAYTPSKNQDKRILGVLRIRKYDNIQFDTGYPPNKDKNMKEYMKSAKILNCNYLTDSYSCHSVTELKPVTERNLLSSFEYHTVDFFMEGPFFVSIDNGAYTQNLIPKTSLIMKSHEQLFSSHTNILSLPDKKSVTIVLRNRSYGNHPMHMHGHHFEIIGIAKRTVNCKESPYNSYCPLLDVNTAFSEPIEILMKQEKQGVLKDTVIVPAGGAVALRINTDNPGVWFFHCHMKIDFLDGLAIAINEGNFMHSLTSQEVPKDYPSCDFSGNLQYLRSATCFCNSTARITEDHFRNTDKPVNIAINAKNENEKLLAKKCSSVSSCY